MMLVQSLLAYMCMCIVINVCAYHPLGDPVRGQCLFGKQRLTFELDGSPRSCTVSLSKPFPVPREMETSRQSGREGGVPNSFCISITSNSHYYSLFSLILPLLCIFFPFCPFFLPSVSFCWCFPNHTHPGFNLPPERQDFYIIGLINIAWSGTLKISFVGKEISTKMGGEKD